MPVPPLYVCPDCEPGPYFYAGKIIAKRCSSCEAARREAQTGFDRARTGSDRRKIHREAELLGASAGVRRLLGLS